MRKIIIFIYLCVAVSLSSCSDFFELRGNNNRTEDNFEIEPDMIRGLVISAYSAVPNKFTTSLGGNYMDCATDNAIASDISTSSYKWLYQPGYLSPDSSPMDIWNSRYENINSINEFFARTKDKEINYIPSDMEANARYNVIMTGFAHFVRAWINFDLMRCYAGVDVNGDMVSHPLVFEQFKDFDNIKYLKRNSVADCVEAIITDLDTIIDNDMLPVEFTGDDYIEGEERLGYPSLTATLALKSRVLLYAASKAYLNDKSLFEKAAETASKAITVSGSKLPAINYENYRTKSNATTNKALGETFFNQDDHSEIILRRGVVNDNASSTDQFPPLANKLNGGGETNPSQNLVDAFPMANGYPITDAANSGYDRNNMYANRDPRFYATIIYNGSKFKNNVIQTFDGGNCMIGAGGVTDVNTTKTGYFLRKWLSATASKTPKNVSDYHYAALFRKVELYLNFAEAAYEAYGPDGDVNGMTARKAIKVIRERAGITNHNYIDNISDEDFREFVRNERRIELCFEDHRFFDLRRWGISLSEPLKGISFTGASDKVGTIKDVATPVALPLYAPIPHDEVMRSQGSITQNQGWL